MAGERKYTRIPPESTGDRVYMIHTAEINYDGKDVAHVWQVGEFYTITGNGGDTFNVHLHGVYEATTTTGRLSVHYAKAAKESGSIAADDQSIEYNSSPIATVLGDAYDLYTPAQQIVGFGNPDYGMNVDRYGSASTTFAEGDPEVTVFGKLRVTNPRLLANYDFTNSKLKDQFVNSNEGAGVTVTYDEDNGYVRLYNPDSAAFARSTHTSNLFHAMAHGTGMYYVFGVRLGDTGKDHVIRNWGPFDATDGFFFQLNGTTLNVVHRSTFAAKYEHTAAQSTWNRDTLDGTGGEANPSGMNLNVTKSNIYWTDFQNLGAGTVRFGVFYKGRRIVCHTMAMENGAGHAGSGNTNALRSQHRPLCFAQALTGAGTPGSASEMFALGGAVYYEGTDDPLSYAQQYSRSTTTKVFGAPQDKPFHRTYQSDGGQPGTVAANSYSSDTATQYQFSISPIQFYANSGTPGKENHSVYQPLKFYFGCYDAVTGLARSIEVRIFSGCVIRERNYNLPSVSSPTVVLDQSGDHISHGPEIARITVTGDQVLEFTSSDNSYQYNTVRNISDQAFARNVQPLAEFKTDDDKYSTGRGASRVKVTIKEHPIFGTNTHFFEDKQPIVISQNDAGFAFTAFTGTNALKTSAPSGYASVDYSTDTTNWYYLSIIGNAEAWLYNSLADLDNDRTVRIVTVSGVGTTAVGDTFTVTTAGPAIGATATVIKIVGNDLYIVGRSLATGDADADVESSLDVGLLSGSFDTTTGGVTVGTIDSIALNTVDTDLKDYWTSLRAFGARAADSTTNLGFDTLQTLSDPDLSLYGAPPPRQAWVFMAKNVASNTPDEDGDFIPVLNNAILKTTVIWRERTL